MATSTSDLESDLTDLTLEETLTDRSFVLERFIDSHPDGQDARDAWTDANSRTVVKLPRIRCSKYTVIGDPSMEKRRRGRDDQAVWTLPEAQPPPKQTVRIKATIRRKKKKGSQGSSGGNSQTLHQTIPVCDQIPEIVPQKQVVSKATVRVSQQKAPRKSSPQRAAPNKIPPLKKTYNILGELTKPARSVHDMEKDNLFDATKFKKLYLRMAQPKDIPMPGPLECSERFQDLQIEPQLIQEKMLVLGEYLQTSKFQRYRQDRAVIPAGFDDVFRSKTFTRHYVTAMYVDDHEKRLQRERTRPSCIRRELSKCHYCDVIGNKYCKSCIESKNKWFGANVERRPLSLPLHTFHNP